MKKNLIMLIMCILAMLYKADAQMIGIQHLSTYETGIFNDSGSEIVAYDPLSQKVFSTNGSLNRVDMIDISDVNAPTLTGSIDLSTYGGGVQSLSIYNGVIAVAVEAVTVGTDPGSVVFFDNTGAYLNAVMVGALPDMVAFSPNGNYVLTANEGEPDDNYTVDPLGSVSVINMSAGAQNLTQSDVTTLDFSAYNSQSIPGLRVYGPNASFAQDMEPEYVAFNATGSEAYVILQENNGVAKIDLTNTPSIVSVSGLGYKDWGSYQLDASNRSSAIDFRSFDNLFGMYQPDAIKGVSYGSKSYIITANEGDSRDYDGYSEEDRVGDLVLDTVAFPSASALQDDELLGRLKITTSMGDTDNDGSYEELYSYGGRSFSIVDPATGRIVYDSGDMIEQMVAQLEPAYFNSNNDDNSSFKSRSDDKGPEPEAIEVATIAGNTYAFVGLERHGGIMCFDISDTANVAFEFFYNNRNWSMPENAPGVGDLGPEDLKFIPAASSPNGKDLLLLSAEVSGTVSLYEVGANVGSTPLSIMHNNDGESQLINAGSGVEDFGGVARFKTLIENMRNSASNNGRAHLTLSSGDNFLAGPEFSAGLNRSNGPLYDAIALAEIDYDAICLGNHDFDFGPGLLANFINDVNGINPTPYLSANLDMSTEPALSGLASSGDIASSTIVNKGGEQIGIVGATTAQLNNISSPGQITIDTDVASAVQNEIDDLMGQGVDKIILISHLQGIDEDTALIAQLTGVDVVIAGGGSELLGDTNTALVPGDGPIYGPYPLTKTDASGRTVYVVTTPGEYKYVGQLNLTFNSSGEVSSIDAGSGLYRVGNTNVSGGVASDSLLQSNVVDSVSAYVADLASNIIATSEVELDGRRNSVRGMETNEGNMIADAMLWQANKNAASFGAPNADIGIQNGGGIRNNNLIAPGPISELNTFDMLPFSNFVTIVEDITPARFKEMMENSVSRITGSGPSGGGTGRFAQIAGFSIIMDTAATALSYDVSGNILQAGNRIIDIQLDNGTYIVQNGQVLTGAPNVNLAVADFTAKGGDQYPIDDLNRTLVGATYQQALFNYITAGDGLNGLIDSTQYPEGGSGRIGYGTANLCADMIDSVEAINSAKGIYRVWFNNPMPTATSYSLEWKPDTASTWRSKSLEGANQAWKNINTNPWFDSDIDVRVVLDDAGSISYSCEEQFYNPCRPMTLQTAQQIAPRCAGDSVLLRVGIAGGVGAKSISWSNGATTKRTYASQGETLTVTVTDASGCSENASVTAETLLNTSAAPSSVGTSRTGTVVTVTWNASNLSSGQSLIGYRVQYRLRGTTSWSQTSLTTNTTADVDFAGGTAGNYDFTVLARYNDNGTPRSSSRACFVVQGVPVTKNEVANGNKDAADIAVYPNPTRSQIYVSATSGSEVSLIDLSGRIIAVQTIDQSEVAFDLTSMSSGIYLMQIKNNGEVITERVVKK